MWNSPLTRSRPRNKSPQFGDFCFDCAKIRCMKKVFLIIVLLCVGTLYFYTKSEPAIKPDLSDKTAEGSFKPDPSNATFAFDDGPVTLSSGRGEKAANSENTFSEEITLMDIFAYGDINTDGKEDTVLLLARYGGGSGIFIYLAAFVSGPVAYKGSETVFVGDRITPQSISIDNETITIKYLDRGPDDAFSTEPTVLTTKQFKYQDGKLQEE